MTECNSTECNSTDRNSYETPNIYPNLHDQQQFRLNKISKIKYYFAAEIKERKLMSKELSKYIACFDYFDKSLIVLSVTTGSISIASFATVIGAPAWLVSTSFRLAFFFYRNHKKLLKTTRDKNKKHKKIVMVARRKSNSVESKIS